MKFDYYTAPSEEVFEEIKLKAIEIWKEYDDTYGYSTEKVSRIENLKNVRDNAWFIVAMFDSLNQERLISRVSSETGELIRAAING